MTIDKDKVITYQTKPQSNSDCSFTCKGIKNELCETAIRLSCDDLMTPDIVHLDVEQSNCHTIPQTCS